MSLRLGERRTSDSPRARNKCPETDSSRVADVHTEEGSHLLGNEGHSVSEKTSRA